MIDSPEILFPLLLGAFLIDVLAGLTWWPPYFRIGIPLFVRKQPFQQALPELPDVAELTEKFSGPWVMPIRFERLSSTQIAVRESFWGGFFKLTYTPLVHGLLEVDTHARELRIVGRANAFSLMFIIFFAIWMVPRLSANDLGAIPFFVGVITLLVVVQFIRYGNVLFETRRQMENTRDQNA